MNSLPDHPVVEGFTLESADSVRFSDEFNQAEIGRNHRLLLGEALGGLLLGEPVWSNIPFAFDSIGLVRILGSLAKAFNRVKTSFLPFQLCAYDGDGGVKWTRFSEVYTRVIANRLPGTFKFSSLPLLNGDEGRRKKAGDAFKKAVEGDAWSAADLTGCLGDEEEYQHFESIAEIDRFIRSRCGDRTFSHASLPIPVRVIRQRTGMPSLREFMGTAVSLDDFLRLNPALSQAKGVLCGIIARHDTHRDPDSRPPLADRSAFRAAMIRSGCPADSEDYRILIEVADAQYLRTQYRSLSHASREVSSAASASASSALGEAWARESVGRSPLKEPGEAVFRFVNRIIAVSDGEAPVVVDLESLFSDFAKMTADPLAVSDLRTFQALLAKARHGAVHEDQLEDSVCTITDTANRWLRPHGVEFFYNNPAQALAVRVRDTVASAASLTPHAGVPPPDLPDSEAFASMIRETSSNACVDASVKNAD